MKSLLMIFVTGTLLLGTANAQAIFNVPNASAEISFYDGDPANGGTMMDTIRMNNSPVAQRHGHLRGSNFISIAFEGESYTFKTWRGGASKNSIHLNINGGAQEDAMTLAKLLDDLARNPNLLEELSN